MRYYVFECFWRFHQRCRVLAKAPMEVRRIMDALHASDPPNLNLESAGKSGEGGGNAGDGLQVFKTSKTQAYNDLIRVYNTAGEGDIVFDVIDEMEKHAIEMNFETLSVLQQRFSYYPSH